MNHDETQAVTPMPRPQRPAKLPPAAGAVADKLGSMPAPRPSSASPWNATAFTVIPVAQRLIGTGAGGGVTAGRMTSAGAGAGGAAITRPLGYIEVEPARRGLRPFQRPWQNPGTLASCLIAFALLLLAKLAGR